MKKKGLKYLWIFLAAFLLISIILFSIVLSNENAIKKYAVDRLNAELISKVTVEDIDLTLFGNFPYVSLDFHQVNIAEPIAEKKTLLKAQHVYISFNLYDILLHNYEIKEINIDSGICNISIDSKGQANYHILRESGDSSQSILHLNKIALTRMRVYYKDVINKQDYDFLIHDASLSFSGNSSLNELTCDANVFVQHLKSGAMNLLREKNTEVNFAIRLNDVQKSLDIRKAEIKIEKISFLTKGSITYGKVPYLDLQISANETTITEMVHLFPFKYPQELASYKSDGLVLLNATVKGKLTDSRNPAIVIDFALHDGSLTEPHSGTSLTGIECLGSFTNGKDHNLSSSVLSFKSFEAKLEGGKVKGDISVKDFSHPYLDLSCNLEMQIAPLLKFEQNKYVSDAKGSVKAELKISGLISDLSKNSGARLISKGHLQIMANDIHIPEADKIISHFEADLNLDGDQISITNCKAINDKTDISIKGEILNIYGYLFEKGKLDANLTYRSDFLDVEKMMISTGNNKSHDSSDIILPSRMTVNVVFEISELNYKLFQAKQVSGKLSWKENGFVLHTLSAKTMSGNITCNARMDNSPDGKYLIYLKGDLTDLNLKELFRECDNFGQNEITSDHINGILNGQIEMMSVWNRKFEAEKEKLHVSSSIEIRNGGLSNYKPLESLSRYAKIEDLRNLRFSDLKNTILISDQTVYIPEMQISNNALNVTMSGKHSFDNNIDYKFKIRLKDLLSNKRKSEMNEYGEADETGKGMYLYLTMTGPISNPKISYDKMAVKNKISSDLTKEKESIKNIFKKELGIEKDSLIKEKDKNSDELEFEK